MRIDGRSGEWVPAEPVSLAGGDRPADPSPWRSWPAPRWLAPRYWIWDAGAPHRPPTHDAAQFRGALVAAANDLHTARLAMTALLTPRQIDTLVGPTTPRELVVLPVSSTDTPIVPEALAVMPPAPAAAPTGLGRLAGPLDVDSLTRAAVASRPDVVAARRLADAATAGVRVAHGDRWSDIDLTLGTSYFTRGTNAIDPTPTFSSINVGLSVPIPLSNFTHGELAGAQFSARQAAKAVQSAEWKASIDVRTAWATYQSALAQVAQYSGGILVDAERVRRAKLYSYQHGSASLLDVLSIQCGIRSQWPRRSRMSATGEAPEA